LADVGILVYKSLCKEIAGDTVIAAVDDDDDDDDDNAADAVISAFSPSSSLRITKK